MSDIQFRFVKSKLSKSNIDYEVRFSDSVFEKMQSPTHAKVRSDPFYGSHTLEFYYEDFVTDPVTGGRYSGITLFDTPGIFRFRTRKTPGYKHWIYIPESLMEGIKTPSCLQNIWIDINPKFILYPGGTVENSSSLSIVLDDYSN